MADARFKVYDKAKFRRENHDLAGESVLIIDRRKSDDGSWVYTVLPDAPGAEGSSCECVESELSPLETDERQPDSEPLAETVFRIEDVEFVVNSAWLICSIAEDGSTAWDVRINAQGEHRGHKLSTRVRFDDLIVKPPVKLHHWEELDNVIVDWSHCYESRFQARLDTMKSYPIRNGHIELSFDSGTLFHLRCEGTCDIGWEPDLAWDLSLNLDLRVEFAGVWGGDWAKVFSPDLFELCDSVLDWRDRMYRPKARIRTT